MKPWLTLVAVLGLACGSGGQHPKTPTTPSAPAAPATDARCGGEAPGPGYECMQTCGPPMHRPSDPVPEWQWLGADDAKLRRQSGCPK